MKKSFLIFVVNIIFILPLLGQSEFDYKIINQIIEQEENYLTEDSICFLTNPKLHSDEFGNKEKNTKELIEWYSGGINRLLKDTLPQYLNKISNKEVKKSFVNWNKEKVNYSKITKHENENFVYISKPIQIDSGLYITINVHHTKLGGISITLYSFENQKLKEIKSRTIRRIGVKFRT